MTGDLPDWLADPVLDPVYARLRDRLERGGLEPAGRVRISLASRAQRHAVAALLGRTLTREAVTIDLATLDERLRQRSGRGGVLDVVEGWAGTPLRDRAGERDRQRARREQPLALLGELLDRPWSEELTAALRRSGLLTRAADPEQTVREAAAVLRELTGTTRTRSRVEVAAQETGDAHALDEDRLLHRVVLRGLAAASGEPAPESLTDRWRLWESFGVGPDAVSSTCLVLGLTASGSGSAPTDPPASGDGSALGGGSGPGRLGAAREAGDPVHLTRWDLSRLDSFTRPTRPVLVCENPRVLEAVAETYAGSVPVLCTAGEPSSVVSEVLQRLGDADAELRYHGDFDWPGLAIVNRLRGRFGAVPWRMGVEDYERSVRADAPELVGTPVEPSWDAELGAAMRAHGRCLHEETVLPELLEALRG